MRLRTILAILVLTLSMTGLVVVGLGLDGGTTLSERWVSDTPRDNEFNHHPIGVSGDGTTVVAPVAAVPTEDDRPTDASCVLASLDPADGAVLWRHAIPADSCMSHAITEPAVGDLDGDDSPEIAFSTTQEQLVVLERERGGERFTVPQPLYGYGPPAIADLDTSPGREVVASDIGGNVVLADANGTVLWRRSLNESFDGSPTVWDAPIVADVDGDGDREITVGTRDGPVVLSTDGTVEWAGSMGATQLVATQADADDALELFAVASTEVRAVDGGTHEQTWERDFGVVARLQAAGDTDDDGDVELHVGLANGTVATVDSATGRTEWTTTVTTAEDGSLVAPVVAQIDDEAVIVAAARDGTVAILDPATGGERAVYERDVPIWTPPTPADLDDDGTDEILVRYGDGRVVALGMDG